MTMITDQSLKLAIEEPWVWSFNDFLLLASAYEGG